MMKVYKYIVRFLCLGFLLAGLSMESWGQTTILSEGFEEAGSFPPTSWVVLNGGTGNNWVLNTNGGGWGTAHTGTYNAEYRYNASHAANTWLISLGLNLTAGTVYTITYWEVVGSATYPENLKVTVGTLQTIAGQTTTLQTLAGLTNTAYVQKSTTYTPGSSGTYYFGWNCYSAANEDYLDIDDILITYPCVPPAVPTLPVLGTTPICPSANSTVQATSAGNTINYWTAASGGTLIGNGASGTAFTVTPASTTTYYAEAQKSVGCVSATRLLVGTITVNSTNAVSVSIAAVPSGTIASGTSVTFTATPTNGGAGPSYQWQKNGSNVGTNSTTYTDAGLNNGDVITCILTSNIACPTGNPATSSGITMTVVTSPVTFTSNGTFTAPGGVCAVTVECWGGGGAGGGVTASSTISTGGGGAGGSYAQGVNVPVIPGNGYTVVVGNGGTATSGAAGGAGGNSSFATSTVIAVGGAGGTFGHNANGALSTGSTTGDAGTGFQAGGGGSVGKNSSYGGGGGGGGGGTTASGGTSTNSATGGTGGTSGGGGGGNGGSFSGSGNNPGSPGTAPGGAGGGAATNIVGSNAGGAGGAGQVIISWVTNTCCTPVLTMTSNNPSAASQCAGTSNVILQSFEIAVTSCNGSMTDLGFTPGGTFAAADLSDFKLYYTTTSTFSTANLLATISSPGTVPQTFPAFSSPTLTSGSSYWFWITADIASAVTAGHTVSVAGITNANITAVGITGGPTTAGGAQTLTVPPTTATNGSTQSICTSGTATLSGNNPTTGTGLWSVVSGPSTLSSQFASTSTYNTTFTPAGGAGSYVIQWTISNPPCVASSANATITVTAVPTTQTTSIAASSITASGATLTASGGNGTNDLIIVSTSPFTGATPSGVYTANAAFPTGTAFDGGHVVYNGTGNSVAVTGLAANTTYYVEDFGFNGTDCYYVSSPATTTFATIGEVYNSQTGLSYTTIQAAVNAFGGTVSGGAQYVEIQNSNTFNESVTISNITTSAVNTLTIRAQAGRTPVISSGGNSCFEITKTNYVTLLNLSITGATTNNDNYGISVDGGNSGACTNLTINGCAIYGNGGQGIEVQNNAGNNMLIENCLIYSNGADGIQIYPGASMTGLQIINNTIYNNNTANTAWGGIFIAGASSSNAITGIILKNNIIEVGYNPSNSNEACFVFGYHGGGTFPADVTFTDCNYNDLYFSGSNNSIGWKNFGTGGSNYTTLASWRTAMTTDANSISSVPSFVTPGTDFHETSTAGHATGNVWPPSAAPTGWSNDGSNSPCIDAGTPTDSYANEPPCNGSIINQGCYGNTVQASKSVNNCGTITTSTTIAGSPFCQGASVSVPYTITGTYAAGNVFTAQLSSSAGSFAAPVTIGTLTSQVAGTINANPGIIPTNAAAGAGYLIRVVSSNPVVTGTTNTVNLTVSAAGPTITSTTPGSECATGSVSLQAVGSAGTVYWYAAATGGAAIGTGSPWSTPSISSTTTYYVDASSGACHSATRTAVIATVSGAPTAPVSAAGTSIATTSFSANWNTVAGATDYYLDVSTVNTFATYVTGYSNLSVGNVLTYSVTGLSATTTYYYRVRSFNSCGTSANSGTQNVTTTALIYCTPTYTNLCSDGYYTNNFSTTGGSTNITNNGSGCDGNANNFIFYNGVTPAVGTVTVIAGNSFNVSMQGASGHGFGFRIWIDFNQDGNFGDAGDDVFNSVSSGNGPFTGTISIPSGAMSGTTRMRVRSLHSGLPLTGDYCDNLTDGETEDYVITITSPCSSSLALASNAPGAATQCEAATNVVLQSFSLNVSSCNGNLTDVSFPTTGTYSATDVLDFNLFYTTTSTFDTTNLLSTIAVPATAGTQTFPSFTSPTLVNGSQYWFWITTDLNASATNTSTIKGGAIAAGNLTSTSTLTGGPAVAAGTQTFANTTLLTQYITNTFPSGGWSSVTVVGSGTAPSLTYPTTSANPSGFGPSNGSNTHIVDFNSFTCSAGDEMLLYNATPFATTGDQNVTVSFDWLLQSTYNTGDGVYVCWSTVGSTQADLLANQSPIILSNGAANGWSNQFFTLPSGAANQAHLYIGFLFYSGFGNDCYMDNIFVNGCNSCTPALVLASNTVGFNSECAGTTKVPLQSFSLAFSGGCPGSLTDVGFTTTGSYAQADIGQYQLWYSSTNTLSSATQLGTSLASAGTAGARSFAAFSSPTLASGSTYYFWITADITAGATNGNTIACNAISTATLTSCASSGGPTTAGGIQTFVTAPVVAAIGGGPAGGFVCVGSSTPAYTNATGAGVWSVTDLTGSATNAGAVVTGVSAGTENVNYSVTNGSGCTTTVTTPLDIIALAGAAGSITGVTPVCQGQQNVSYSIATIANASSYTWVYSGTGATISGTSKDITINFSATATSGNLTVQGTNSCGSGTASPAFAVVVNPTPVITTQPITPQTVGTGTNAVFTVATSASSPTYQWMMSPDNATWVNVANGTPSGATYLNSTTASLTVNSTATVANYYYMCVITSGGCSVNSNSGDLTVVSACSLAKTLPWTENFDELGTSIGATILPQCWTYQNITGTDYPGTGSNATINSTYATYHSSPNYMYAQWNNTAWVFTPMFSFTGGQTYSFSFWMENADVTSPVDFSMNVSYGASQTSGGMTHALASGVNCNNSSWTQFTYNFTPAATGNYYFGIECTSTTTTPWYLSFDDFSCTTTCNVPTITLGANPAVCSGVTAANLTYSATTNSPNKYDITWSAAALTAGFVNITGYTTALPASPIPLVVPSAGAAATYSATLNVENSVTSCVSAPVAFTVTINPLPAAAGAITGTATECQGTNNVSYSVGAIANATGYTWTYSGTGFSIATGSGTDAITADFSATATSGNLTVTGTNACGNGTISANYAITINALPAAAGAITGTNNPCQGLTGVAYSVGAITGATNYTWNYTAGSGFSIATGSGLDAITANFTNTATSCTLTVTGSNTCGSGTVSANYVITPSSATTAPYAGPNQYLCTGTTSTTMALATGTTGNVTWSLISTTDPAPAITYGNVNTAATTISGMHGGSGYIYIFRLAANCGTSYSEVMIVVQ